MRCGFFCLIGFLFLASCGSTAEQPASRAGTADGEAVFIYPQTGTLVYAEVLFISGTWTGEQPASLRVEGRDAAGTVLVQADIAAAGDTWQAELLHAYSGEPVEVLLRVLSPDGSTVHAESSIVLAGTGYRPTGSFGHILQPRAGQTLSGGSIRVGGSVSGLPDNTFQLTLSAEDGTILDETSLTVLNPYGIDEVPYEAELQTRAALGQVTLRAAARSTVDDSPIPLGSVDFILGTDPG